MLGLPGGDGQVDRRLVRKTRTGFFTALSDMQLARASDGNGDGAIGAAELLIGRDGIALALPSAAGLPYVLTALMATAALAIAREGLPLPAMNPIAIVPKAATALVES